MAPWRNSENTYGLMAIICHWLTAVAVVGLFILGLWMTDLNYYSPWYQKGPDIHRSVGILLALLVIWRLVWRMLNRQPVHLPNHKKWERILARLTHLVLYVLLFAMFISGYLITTAEGQALSVFNWFQIPAATTGTEIGVDNLEDVAGDVHEVLAFTLIALASIHALAAIKHHVIDKDSTLLRMLGKSQRRITKTHQGENHEDN